MARPSLRNWVSDKTLWQPYCITPRTGTQYLDLSENRTLGYLDQAVGNLSELANLKDPFVAKTPTTIQMALHLAGKLPHPYYFQKAKKYEWVDKKVWYYRKTVQVPASAAGQNVFLCFDGLDYSVYRPLCPSMLDDPTTLQKYRKPPRHHDVPETGPPSPPGRG